MVDGATLVKALTERTDPHHGGARLRVEAPHTCEYCPFAAKTREPFLEIANDPAEAHYLCPVLGKDIWGEEPECGDKLTEMAIAALKS